MDKYTRGSGIDNTASDLGSHIKDGRSEAKSLVSDSVDEAASAVGRTVVSAATAADAATREATDGLQKAGRYMQDNSPETMRQDLWKVARAHPTAALFFGLGVGVVVSRVLRMLRRSA